MANRALQSFDDVEIRFRPMLLGAVMKATGNRPPASVPAKGAYLRQDLERWARHYEVPFRMNSRFPQNTIRPLRLALVAQERGGFERLHERLYDTMFLEDGDITDDAVLAALLSAEGLDADDYLAATESPTIKDKLKSNTEEAVARGAFGAPTFFVGDALFFGNDRFDFIREALGLA